MSAILKPVIDDLYARLCALPPNQVGEIIDGKLYAHPRPAGPHALAASSLGGELYGPYQRGRGGPGGWWILDEPEIHFVRNTLVCVPDLAGWRKQRLPHVPRGHRFGIVPDWVCEVPSPGTAREDRAEKMPVYARYGVAYLWLVDPLERTLEACILRDGSWMPGGTYAGDDVVNAPPFGEFALHLADLWPEAWEGNGADVGEDG